MNRRLRDRLAIPDWKSGIFVGAVSNTRGDDIKGVRLTRLGRRVYSDSLTPMQDPWGRQIYWIGGGSIAWSGEETSDFRAIQEGYISVTPLHLDLTHHAMLASAEGWWQLP